MNRVVVDTDVASYIFKGHHAAIGWSYALGDAPLYISFMSLAEMRMEAIADAWGLRRTAALERYFNLKTAVEDSLSAQVLCLQAVTDTAVVTKFVKCEAVATSMDSSA